MDDAQRAAARGHLIGMGWVMAMALGLSALPVMAQSVEQHPAPVLTGPQTATITTTALETRQTDPTPFGVNLSGLMVVDAHANGVLARPKTGAGVNTSLAGATARSAGFQTLMQKYVGQPLSYRLIAGIEADITRFYRDNGRSLVLVTVPPQEITSGVLQVNVNTFVLETTEVQGAKAGSEGFVASQIRMKPGQEVDTARLLDDVNWLNQNPFRHVSVVFEPGAGADATKLTLQVQSTRPWSAYVGMSNSGTGDTDPLRVFGGFNVSALAWQDRQLSYQGNFAPSSLLGGHLWDAGQDRGYLSHSVSYFVPLTLQDGARTKLTFGLSHISSYSSPKPATGFTTATTTDGATVEEAFPLPKTTGTWSLLPEAYLGWAFNAYDRDSLFGLAPIDTEHSHLQHLAIGIRSGVTGKIFGKPSRGKVDASVTFGKLETDGSPSDLYSFAKISGSQEIFIDSHRSVNIALGAQYSGGFLHSIEQLSLGGDATVRGYPTGAVSSQSAAYFSVEYRAAPVTVPMGKTPGQFRPHVFADFGIGAATDTAPTEHMAAIGFGGDISLGDNLIGKLDLAHVLTGVDGTPAGTNSIAFQLTSRF